MIWWVGGPAIKLANRQALYVVCMLIAYMCFVLSIEQKKLSMLFMLIGIHFFSANHSLHGGVVVERGSVKTEKYRIRLIPF